MSFPYVLSNLTVQTPVVLEEDVVTGKVPRQFVQSCTTTTRRTPSKGVY